MLPCAELLPNTDAWRGEIEGGSVFSAAGAAVAGCSESPAPNPVSSEKPLGRPLAYSRAHVAATCKWRSPGELSFELS